MTNYGSGLWLCFVVKICVKIEKVFDWNFLKVVVDLDPLIMVVSLW